MLLDLISNFASFLSLHQKALTSPPATTLVILALALFTWRIWRFTISVYLYPHRVKELPYWIPCRKLPSFSLDITLITVLLVVGHALGFYRNSGAVVAAAVRITNGLYEPFAVNILGKKLYFITNPSDVSESFRNITTLSWEKYLDELLVCFGVRSDMISLLHEETPALQEHFSTVTKNKMQPNRLIDFAALAYKRQLAVDKVDELSAPFFKSVLDTSSWSQLSSQSTYPGQVRHTIRGLLDVTLSRAIAQMFFGRAIFHIEPEITKHTLGFSDGLWRLIYHYPRCLASDFYTSYDKIMHAIEKYAATDPEATADASFVVRSMVEAEKLAGLDVRSAAALTSIMYLAAFANVHSTSFWLLSYIAFDPDLKAALLAEIMPAFQNGKFDTNYIVNHCPLLDSCFREVLRLHIVSFSLRLIDAPTHFSGKTLEPGNILLVPFGRLHHDEAVWGNNHHQFSPTRFLKNGLASHPAYRPFGGGLNACPGKALAARQTLSYVAFMLYSYEIAVPEMNGKVQQVPLADENTPTFGTSVPRKGMDPTVDLSPSSRPPVEFVISCP
jgi:hypothetical protein